MRLFSMLVSGLAKLFTNRMEAKVLQEMQIGVGVSGGPLAESLLKDELKVIMDVVRSRGATCLFLTPEQAGWIQLPLDINEMRPAYNLYCQDPHPKAECYIILGLDPNTKLLKFGIYGASFYPLLEDDCSIESVGMGTLRKYIQHTLGGNIALARCRFPEAFTGALAYGPRNDRGIKAIFTLPPLS